MPSSQSQKTQIAVILSNYCIILRQNKRKRKLFSWSWAQGNYTICGRAPSTYSNFLAWGGRQRDEDGEEVAGDRVVTPGRRREPPLSRPRLPRRRRAHQCPYGLF
ncbi:unnamed protein product [Musa acuminata subsp. burmannicoides]